MMNNEIPIFEKEAFQKLINIINKEMNKKLLLEIK